ncbi:MAG: hypothetical protein LBT97_03315 [Planctomycetota bacterium]|jgi:hypothetical protein|nr:hypothetical protein [Planctomycetota bacterium]
MNVGWYCAQGNIAPAVCRKLNWIDNDIQRRFDNDADYCLVWDNILEAAFSPLSVAGMTIRAELWERT